jgi:predicted DNA-binding protein
MATDDDIVEKGSEAVTPQDEVMVMRTLYLPRSLDRRLKELAYDREKSKNEIIREILLKNLAQHERE